MPSQTEEPVETAVELTRIARKTGQARMALGFERLWSALHWPLVILALAAALVIGGVLPQLPLWPRLAALLVITLSLLWSLWPLRHLRWPTRQEAMRRVEEKSGLSHRPVSAADDSLAAGLSGPVQQAIWEEHRARQLRRLGALKAGVPRSSWRDIDPRALRLPAALALIAAILLGPGDPRSNLADSLAFSAPAPAPHMAIDAWVKPPAYTGMPPVLLTSPAMAERLKTDPDIHIPEKSVLSLRVAGAKAPVLSFHAPVDGPEPSPEVQGFKPQVKSAEGLYQAEVPLERPAIVKLTDGGKELGSWRILLIPDAPPKIEITGTKGDGSGMLTAKWRASDDYGVAGITADIYLADEQDDGEGFTDAGIFEFDPPKLPISLRKASPRDEAGESKADVAEHPWAGFMVEMTLTARDAAGNKTTSEKRVFRLPERQFTKPLARAVIEQRRRLILDPEESGGVAEMLDAILTYPQGLIESSGPHLAIAAALSRLRDSEDRAGIDDVIGLLWQIAVNVEDGALADAKAELEAVRKELEKALRDGAPPERIAQLTEKLRKAMDRYLQSMMEDAKKRMAEGQKNQAPQQGKMVTPQDLQKMLDMIDKLAKSGDMEAAQQMLSELENILRNMKPGMAQQGQQGQEGPLSQMLDKLSDLMRQQQKLMDETQRMPQQGMGEDPQDGEGQQPGQQGDQPGSGMGGLGDRQQGLSQMLEQLMKQFGQNGLDAPRAFGEAGRNMGRAEGSLRDGDREQALGEQGEAMAKLREGAQGLARQMMQQSQGQQGNEGRDGEARGDDRDPLGRPLPSTSEDTGPSRDMLPSEQALQRAREILDLLRSRAGDLGLPKVERDYIDRLLRGLY